MRNNNAEVGRGSGRIGGPVSQLLDNIGLCESRRTCEVSFCSSASRIVLMNPIIGFLPLRPRLLGFAESGDVFGPLLNLKALALFAACSSRACAKNGSMAAPAAEAAWSTGA
jgi:hypothetical protein